MLTAQNGDLLVDTASATSSAAAAATSSANAATSETKCSSIFSFGNSLILQQVRRNAETAQTASRDSSDSSRNCTEQQLKIAQAAAEAALDNFDDRFLGAKASDPTLDNDGAALTDGALYFDTTNNVMKVYDLGNTTWRQIQLTTADQANVNTVAAQISPTNNISTVAGINSEITTVAGDSADIQTLAAISGLDALAGATADITNVSNNLGEVQNFAQVYRISATAPTTSLDVGDLWFDTTNNVMKVYGSGGFVTAASSINGTASRHKFTATSGQTTFTVDDDGNNLAYDAPYLDTYLNGVKLVNTLDFTATSGTSIVLASGAATNDILEVVAYGTFELANFSINDANDVSTAGITDGQVLTWNASSSTFQAGNASSAEVYGFNKDASGNLIVTTTDGGNDNISSATYASFDDVLFAASGFTFSLSNGDLIATI
jgi:hypothetical protein